MLCSLDHDDAAAIASAQSSLDDHSLRANLIFIKAHFSALPEILTSLQKYGQTLAAQLTRVDRVETLVQQTPEPVGEALRVKWQELMDKNKGLTKLRNISQILVGQPSELPPNFSPKDIADFKFSPITTCDVERSFSRFKGLLSSKRLSFTLENLKMHFVIECSVQNSIADTDLEEKNA